VGLHETLVVETEAAFTILGVLLVFLPMFLSVLARAEGSDSTMPGSRVLVIALAWSVPVLIVLVGLERPSASSRSGATSRQQSQPRCYSWS
jgi:hypothetical protein